MGLPPGLQAREQPRAVCVPNFHVPAARGQHLYRTYEDQQASLSNSYALLGTLMAATRFNGRDSMVERKSAMDEGEPPSTARAKSLFRVGRNSRGNWVVQDQSGLCGGMFVNRTEAVKFAMFENGNRPQAVIVVPGILELDMSAQPREQNGSTAALHAPLPRAA